MAHTGFASARCCAISVCVIDRSGRPRLASHHLCVCNPCEPACDCPLDPRFSGVSVAVGVCCCGAAPLRKCPGVRVALELLGCPSYALSARAASSHCLHDPDTNPAPHEPTAVLLKRPRQHSLTVLCASPYVAI
jgi:hypothetical protein